MTIVVGESWSGNTLVYYPSLKMWGPKRDDRLEESTQDDLANAIHIVNSQGLLIIDIQLQQTEKL